MKATIYMEGGKESYSFPFDFLDPSFVKVSIQAEDGTARELTYQTEYNVTKDKKVVLNGGVSTTVKDTVVVYRETPTNQKVVFNNASVIREKDLNTMDIQLLHLEEENQDRVERDSMIVNPETNTWEARGRRITNVANPQEDGDAVNLSCLKDWDAKAEAAANRAETAQRNAETAQRIAETHSSIAGTYLEKGNEAKNTAKKWATATTSPDDEADSASPTGKTQSSRTWALSAKDSESKAKVSESNAKTSEVNAKTSENNAKAYETSTQNKLNSVTSTVNAANASIKSTGDSYLSQMSAKATQVSDNTTKAQNYATQAKSSADRAEQASVSERKIVEFNNRYNSVDDKLTKVLQTISDLDSKTDNLTKSSDSSGLTVEELEIQEFCRNGGDGRPVLDVDMVGELCEPKCLGTLSLKVYPNAWNFTVRGKPLPEGVKLSDMASFLGSTTFLENGNKKVEKPTYTFRPMSFSLMLESIVSKLKDDKLKGFFTPESSPALFIINQLLPYSYIKPIDISQNAPYIKRITTQPSLRLKASYYVYLIPSEISIGETGMSVRKKSEYDITRYCEVKSFHDELKGWGDYNDWDDVGVFFLINKQDGQPLCSLADFEKTVMPDSDITFNDCYIPFTINGEGEKGMTFCSKKISTVSNKPTALVNWSVPSIKVKTKKELQGLLNYSQRAYIPSNIDFSDITNYTSLFSDFPFLTFAPKINLVGDAQTVFGSKSLLKDISKVDVRNATNLTAAFASCTSLEYVEQFKPLNALTCKGVFRTCTHLEKIDSVDFSGTQSLDEAFNGCYALKALGNVYWNTDTSKCASFYYMFNHCRSLKESPTFDFSNAETISNMFANCTSLEKVQSVFNTSKCKDFSYAFLNCSTLKESPTFDFSNAETISNMFASCDSIEEVPDEISLKDGCDMTQAFQSCTSLKHAPLIKCSSPLIDGLFNGCSSLEYVPDNFFDFCTGITSISSMFGGNTQLKKIPSLGNNLITDYTNAFSDCVKLETVPLLPCGEGELSFDGTFYGCKSLKNVPQLPIERSEYLRETFTGCSSLPAVFPWEFDFTSLELADKEYYKWSDIKYMQNIFTGSSVKKVIFTFNNDTYTKLKAGVEVAKKMESNPRLIQNTQYLKYSNHEDEGDSPMDLTVTFKNAETGETYDILPPAPSEEEPTTGE